MQHRIYKQYANLEDWAANVPPAPRCSKCDQPLSLGEVANRPDYDEEVTEWLCLKCAVHLINPVRSWNGRWAECGFTGERSALSSLGECTMVTTEVEEEATCVRCKRNRESRIYLAKLVKRDIEFRRDNA